MAGGDLRVPDQDLVAKAQRSDAEAFGELYERHRERVYRIAYRFVHNKADALDLCQEVFVRAYQSLPNFQRKAKFTTWLTRIANNACVDFCRLAKLRRAGELDEEGVKEDLRRPGVRPSPKPSEGLEREEIREAVDAAIEELSPDHRAVFVLHSVEGLTYEEIATTVGCPIGTVMSRLHYARKHLQGILSWVKQDENDEAVSE